jgi:hypothetical protein
MAAERGGDQTATLLGDGTVLVVGGGPVGAVPPIATEIYDPRRNSWLPGPRTLLPRTGHAAVRLDDGRVLVVGGLQATGPTSPPAVLAGAELYDPRSGAWSAAASMAVPRSRPTLTVLPDSRVLAAGGLTSGGQITATAEVYDPVADRWSAAPPMSTPRSEQVALLLFNGRVLVAGGVDTVQPDGSLNSADLYDYATNSWSRAARMPNPHAGPVAAVLADGVALVAGGFDYQAGFGFGTQASDLYIPSRDSWIAGGPMLVARGMAGGAKLGNGFVIAAGGVSSHAGLQAQNTAEIFDPATRRWSLLPRLPDPRIAASVSPVGRAGAVLVGGSRQQTAYLFAFQPAPLLSGPPTSVTGAITTNQPMLLVTALLLAGVAAQAGWRRRRPAQA